MTDDEGVPTKPLFAAAVVLLVEKGILVFCVESAAVARFRLSSDLLLATGTKSIL